MKKVIINFMLLLAIGVFFSACSKENDQIIPTVEVNEQQLETVTANHKGKTIEALSKEYFAKHQLESQHKDKLIQVTNAFFVKYGQAKEFDNKMPAKIQPIYAYGIEGVAYYEVWFTEDDKTIKGWLLTSTTDKDLPLVNFSLGTPYSSHMLGKTSIDTKVYRFGASYFAREDNSQKVAEYGAFPKVIFNPESTKSQEVNSENGPENETTLELEEGVDYFSIQDYEDLKNNFAQHYFSVKRAQAAREMTASLIAPGASRVAYSYRWTGGSQCYYTQIPANTSSNTTACWAGCNNNAWANLYGWFDRNRGKTRLIPTTSTGETSPLYRNTNARRASVDPVQMYTYTQQGTYCKNGGGWTKTSNAYKGYRYATFKSYGYSYHSYWGNNSTLANIVTEGIANRREPVLVGANSHMYVGYGWAQDPNDTNATWAYCYPGWKTDNSDDLWVWWKDFVVSTRMTVY